MDKLIDGYRRFRAGAWPERRRLFEALADTGQAPRAMIVSCADSRVDPGMIFDAGPGELFVLRNVANLVPPYAPDDALHGTSAALEFGVRVLEVTDILVMGHALCGGIRALRLGVPREAGDFVANWMRIAEPALRATLACDDGSDPQQRCEQEAVRLTLRNLMTFPWIAERVASGALRLHGAHFDIRTGALRMLGANGTFEQVPG
jgi:carbonic anhydrase